MAKIVVRCIYTGHYVVTGFDTTTCKVTEGKVWCPYCNAEHVWYSTQPTPTRPAGHMVAEST